MTDKPIIFTAPEVRAILDGKKSQARRVISSRNSTVLGYEGREFWKYLNWQFAWKDPGPDVFGGGTGYEYLHVDAWNPADGQVPTATTSTEWSDCGGVFYRVRPRLVPGDRLWVRETWSYYEDAELFDCIRYKADGERRKPQFDDFPDVSENVWYQFEMMCDGYGCADHKWRSPVCMPRWASRLTLEVTGVRVERLQEISEADAIAEGIERCDLDIRAVQSELVNHSMECDRFARLWDSINGKTHPWESNPWVWVYEFRRVEE